MQKWQQIIIVIYGIVNLVVFIKGYRETRHRKNAFGLTPKLGPLGIFAWGDAVIFGLFWIGTSAITLILSDWYLFFLIVSVFWVVRSLGETIYWFNQQFSSKSYNWNKPENLPLHSVFHNDSIWFIFQIGWQSVTVVSIILSIYFSQLWLD